MFLMEINDIMPIVCSVNFLIKKLIEGAFLVFHDVDLLVFALVGSVDDQLVVQKLQEVLTKLMVA